MPLKDRDRKFVRPFQNDDVCRFVVSIKRVLGTGVTLTRAFDLSTWTQIGRLTVTYNATEGQSDCHQGTKQYTFTT